MNDATDATALNTRDTSDVVRSSTTPLIGESTLQRGQTGNVIDELLARCVTALEAHEIQRPF